MFLCARTQPSLSLSLTAGAKKLANKAALWYVPCSLQNVDKIMEVPPIKVCGNSCSDLHGAKFGISPVGFSVSIRLCPSEMTGWEVKIRESVRQTIWKKIKKIITFNSVKSLSHCHASFMSYAQFIRDWYYLGTSWDLEISAPRLCVMWPIHTG